MPTTSFSSSSVYSDGCFSGSSATVLAGTGSKTVTARTGDQECSCGTTMVSTNWTANQAIFGFDTSSLPDNAVVTGVTLKLRSQNNWSATPIFNVYGTTNDGSSTSHYVSSSGFASLTKIADGYFVGGNNECVFTANSNFYSHIKTTTTTYILIQINSYVTGTMEDGRQHTFAGSGNSNTALRPLFEVTYNYGQSNSGGISSITGLVSKTSSIHLSGISGSLSGSMITGLQYIKTLSGSISSISANLIRRTNKALAGTYDSSGILNKRTTKSFSGTMGSLTGTLSTVRVYIKSLTGTIGTLSGAVTNRQNGFGKALTGSISSITGSIPSKVSSIHLSGAFTASGRMSVFNTFRSAIIKAGTVVRRIIKGGRDIGYYS